ncbi:CopG family transcriptional regulator [Candidatus Hamiltonella defensa]|uniref:CopG family transcriptional regulator n=1 Tax=Candidatus Williamhamiltonella defendens TaxID=138072 RepID=A0AAC9YGP3_9ENTR|nr:CopG family transcriptional regulator [Candidatus Hamiltonella defensa]ASV34557.1 hypothetical protein CJJ18_11240 [Candidatus Hamiltonella defensa]AWK17516.1 hypothetical protein CCS40_11065 [Candidatus Hamiltonella defensa]MBK4362291.1 CopG family transcriptional regulator [Candidatus Hamiltonella defensa]
MTTSIRLPKELKVRVSEAAGHAGISSHHFILQAIEEKTLKEELNTNFYEEAEKRYTQIIETGECVSWEEMRCYLESLQSVPNPIKPIARKLEFNVKN